MTRSCANHRRSLRRLGAMAAPHDIRITREININGYTAALLPRGHGQLTQLTAPVHRRYPARDHCMQMVAFFSDSSGLLVHTKDPVGYLSDWEIIPGDKLRIHFYGPEHEIEVVEIPPTVEAAAERYKSWARQQVWAQKTKSTLDLSVIAVAPNNNLVQQAKTLQSLYGIPPTPMGAWITQWRAAAFDTMYPDYRPNNTGAFAALLSNLKHNQCTAFPYVNGLLWDTNFEEFNLGPSVAIRQRDGSIPYYNATLPTLMYACPASNVWQDKLTTARESLRDEEGEISSGIYLDMLLASKPMHCFTTHHGHVPGDPLAWQNGIKNILSSTSGVVMSEGNAEVYLNDVDIMLMHSYTNRADTVPLWNYVYGDLQLIAGWQVDPNGTPAELQAELARAQQFGVPHGGSPWMTYRIQEQLLTPKFAGVRKFLGWN